MANMIYLIFGILVLLYISFKIGFEMVIIYDYEKGLRYKRGKFKQILESGLYCNFKKFSTIQKVDTRPRLVSITGQEIVSSDGVSLKISIAACYEITDPFLVINKSENYQDAFYTSLQIILRDIIGNVKIDELLENRNEFSRQLFELSTKKVEELGLKLISADIKDIMFPGELKKIFAQVVKAKKDGLAALERARGESAAMRNMANAAKMIENNPNLLHLRAIQTLSESSGNTIVLGIPSSGAVIPLNRKESTGLNKTNSAEKDVD